VTRDRTPTKSDADRLYDQCVKPLEAAHEGAYAVVSLDGTTFLSPTLLDALEQAEQRFGQRPTMIFKVGEKAVGRLL
jgi:hypothetical protein